MVTGVCFLLIFPLVPSHAQGDEEDHVIRIGLPLPLSGTKSSLGDLHRKSYVMALEEINASGGIRQGKYAGWPMEFLFIDTRGMAETGRESVENLISEQGVSIIMGGYSSAVAFAVAEVCEWKRIPFISSSAAADEITQQGWEFTFRVNPPVNDYNSGLEDFLCNINQPRSMSIVFENTRFGIFSAQGMKNWCDENFIEVLTYEAYEPWAGDFEEIAEEIGASNADIAFVAANLRDSVALVSQLAHSETHPKMLAGSVGTFSAPEFIKGLGPRSENLLASAVWIPQVNYPGANEFVQHYKARYGAEPDYHSAQAYAAAQVCRDILERTLSLEAGDLLEALHTTNMMSVLGPVKFCSYKSFTNQNQLLTLVIQIQDGEFQTIWPPNAATADCAHCDKHGAYDLDTQENLGDRPTFQP
ncbi:MAG: ABC transporter substrate-binding protein [Deltaproteobacteria bacterium]|nr:ABC transporter substrate-binding protein [Deltaproteobacteria bacterium]